MTTTVPSGEAETTPEAMPVKPVKPEEGAPKKGGGFFAPLRIANYRRLIAGQTVSRLGDAFYLIALPWLVLRITDSPGALSLVLGVGALTLGLFTLLGGVLADRYGPRALMLVSDAARLVIMGVLSAFVLVGTPTISGISPLWTLVALSALLGVASGLFYPASTAMMPHLVPADDLQAANSFEQLQFQASNTFGPGIAGVIFTLTQVAFGFVIDAVTFAVSVLTLLLIRMPARATAPNPNAVANEQAQAKGDGKLSEAIRYLAKTPFLATMLGLSLLGNFSVNGLFDVGLPLLLKDLVGFSEGPKALGITISAFGLGSIVGAVIAGATSRIRHKPLVAVICIVPIAGLFALVPLVTNVYVLAAIFAVMGLTLGVSNVLFITVMQRFIPLEMMGRMMSLLLLGSFLGSPLSIFAYGGLASIVPHISYLFFVGAALFAVAAVLALSNKHIWQTE
jgi:MFS family permease